MTPSELLRRLRALDWSGVPLPHQLAVSATYETLKATQPMSANSNVTTLPVRTRWVSLCNIETGARVATSSHFGPSGAWEWIAESVAAELAVDEDAVGCMEDPEGEGDFVTVDGLPVYRIEHWSAPSSN